VHIRAVAMFCLAAAGRMGEAREVASAIRQAQAGYGVADFLTAFKLGGDAALKVRDLARALDGPGSTGSISR
jgi:hypothetical protein